MTHTRLKKNFKNINKKEIKQFDSFATQWWNINGTFKTLHHINKTRLDYIIKHSHGLFGKIVLDVGCGGGILSESMAHNGAQVVGLDMSLNSLTIAKSHALSQNLNIRYISETIEDHALNHNNHYDIITCMELLEHVPNPLSIIHACATISKIGGSVFFSTINRTLKSWLYIIIGAEYLLHIIPKGTHKFNKFITPSELLNWIDTTNLQSENIMGMYYQPFTKICKLTNNISTNYILHTQRFKK